MMPMRLDHAVRTSFGTISEDEGYLTSPAGRAWQRCLHPSKCGLLWVVVLGALLLFPLGVSAQDYEGVIRYSHTSEILHYPFEAYMKVSTEGMGGEYVAPPTHLSISRTMVFDGVASLMYPTDKPYVEPSEIPAREGVEHIDTTYVDIEEGTYVESRIMAGKLYRAEDQRPPIPWQLEGEERVYLGRRVMKATAVTGSSKLEAWFTPEIPLPIGPGLYGGLPGVILMVTNESTGEVYAADSLSQDKPVREPKPPAIGSVVSDSEYHRLKEQTLANDRRRTEDLLRRVEEGKIIFVRRDGQ